MKTIKVKKDKKTGNGILDIADFKNILDITKVKSYTLEEVDDDGQICLILKFYDKNGKHIKCRV